MLVMTLSVNVACMFDPCPGNCVFLFQSTDARALKTFWSINLLAPSLVTSGHFSGYLQVNFAMAGS